MDLVNLDGLTLIGQGSEWFWAMLQMILLVVTLAIIARQLRAQAADNALQRVDNGQTRPRGRREVPCRAWSPRPPEVAPACHGSEPFRLDLLAVSLGPAPGEG
jgi:hypothetical protein